MAGSILSPEKLGISDPDFAKANLYWKNMPQQKDRSRKGIVLSGITDTGAANSISPVLNELIRRGWTAFSMAKGPGEGVLDLEYGFNRSRDFDPARRIALMRGGVLIAGFSAAPSIEASMNYEAHTRGMLVAGVEDYPGAYTSNIKDLFAKEPKIRPGLLLVGNEWAKQVNVDDGYPADQIIVPGFTALDAGAYIDRSRVRKEVRGQLGIAEDELAIGWFGQIGGATIEHLQIFLSGFRSLNLTNYRLLVRLHPYDDNPGSVYDEMFEPVKDKVIYAGRDVERKVERVISALDLGVNERSTTALIGASLGVPFVSIVIDDVNKRHSKMLGLRVGVIEDGTSPLVKNRADMADVLDRVLNDRSYRRDIFSRMENWQSDGKSALRAADAIEERIGG